MAADEEARFLLRDDGAQSERVAVGGVLREQRGIDRQNFLDGDSGKFRGQRREARAHQHDAHGGSQILRQALARRERFPGGSSELAVKLLREN